MTPRTLKDEPLCITEESLFVFHAQQIERYGGLHGARDKNVILAALQRPMNRWSYQESTDFADLAAAYLVAFAATQGFNDGNKRTGLACALVFLGLNGVSFEAEPQDLYEIVMRVATREVGDNEVATWLRERITAIRSPRNP